MGKKQHLSRLAAPATWPIERKKSKWIAKPLAGTHNLKYSMPLVVLLRDVLKLAEISATINKIINRRELLVNGHIVREKNFAIGLFDVLSIPKLNKSYRILLSKNGKFAISEITEKEANILPLKIRNKSVIKKGKVQLNFSNGWNIIAAKDNYKSGDVILFDFKNNKIVKHLKLSKDNLVYITGGKYIGNVAKLGEIKVFGKLKKNKIAILSSDKEHWETNAKYIC